MPDKTASPPPRRATPLPPLPDRAASARPTRESHGAQPALAMLYERDFLAWTEETTRMLRAGLMDELDVTHLAAEMEQLGGSERRELESRLVLLLVHQELAGHDGQSAGHS